MSFKTILTLLVLGLCAAVISMAGVQLKAAWVERQDAQYTLDSVPRLLALTSIVDVLAVESLNVYAMTVSSRQLREDALQDVHDGFSQTDALIEEALLRQKPGFQQRAFEGFAHYKSARAAAIEAAQASPMLRDVASGKTWIKAAKEFEELFQEAVITKAQTSPAITRLVEEIGRFEIALAKDALEMTGLLAARGYFSADAVAAIASNQTAYDLALHQIVHLARDVLPELDVSASVMQEALATEYEQARAEITDIGINGGEFPEVARPDAWLDLTFGALASLQAFRNDTLTFILREEEAGLAKAKRDFLLTASVIGVAILGSLLALLVVIFKVVRPINKSVQAVTELANGNVDFSLAGFSRRAELGALTFAIQSLRDGERQARADRAASMTIKEQLIAEVDKVVSAAALGDFTPRIQPPQGEIDAGTDALVKGVTQLCEIVSGFARDVDRAVGALKEGDLTYLSDQSYEGLFGDVTTGVAGSMMRVREIVGDVQNAAGQIDRVVDGISTSAAELSSRTLQQAASVEESQAIMSNLSDSVIRNSDAARDAAKAGQVVVNEAVAGVQMIDKTSATMALVEKGSRDISDIVTMIEEIAFQTNILALNASVEAARAGSAGSGFAIVAQEVRALAHRVSDAAMTIGDLINTSVSQVQEAAGSVRDTNTALRHIKDEITGVVNAVETIAGLCQEQSNGAAEVVGRFADFKTTAETNQRMADANQSTADALSRSTANMLAKVAFFQTGATDGIDRTPNEDAA